MAGKARVHELAKEFHVTSKEILATLSEQGEFVKSASSTIDAPVARRLREYYANKPARRAEHSQARTPAVRGKPAPKQLTATQATAICKDYRQLYATGADDGRLTKLLAKYAASYGVTRAAVHQVIAADKKRRAADYAAMDRKRRAIDYAALRNLSQRIQHAKPQDRHKEKPVATQSQSLDTEVHLRSRVRAGGLPSLTASLDTAACGQIVMDKNANRQNIVADLQVFDPAAQRYGYLAWRYSAVHRRQAEASVRTAGEQLAAIAHVVGTDKQRLDRLLSLAGDVLGHPVLARHILQREYGDLVDADDIGRSAADELRHIRDKENFLHRALLLIVAAPEQVDRLWQMLDPLQPPHPDQLVENTTALTTAGDRLRSQIAAVQALLSAEDGALAGFLALGRAELSDLQAGRYDYLRAFRDEDIPTNSAAHDDLQELAFTVLPQGEQLRSFLAGMRATGRYHGRQVDEDRLTVLDDLEKHFGADRCQWHTGNRFSRGNDNHYLVLAIKSPDGQHAVAISPLAGEHATYVVRHEGNQAPWNIVLASSKTEARQRGARRLPFTVPASGTDKYTAMRARIIALLECGESTSSNP